MAAGLAAVITAWVMLPANSGGLIGVLVIAAIAAYLGIRYGIVPLLVWRCTHYVLTDERLLLQYGVLTRERRDLPLARINDHTMSQTLVERIFGCGLLTVDWIGDQAAELWSVPRVQQVQTMLYELIETAPPVDGEDDERDEVIDVPLGARPAPPQTRRRGRAPR